MSANDYYGGGNQQSSQYAHSSGNNYGGGPNTPFSPPPPIYTPDSSAQHSPYPGSAQPSSYDQQNAAAGYASYSPAPPDHSNYGGNSPYPSQQQDYGRPHSPYQQPQGGQYGNDQYQRHDQNQNQSQYGYGGYQQPYDQSYTPNPSGANDYAARFGGNSHSPLPSHASPSYPNANYDNQVPPGSYAQPGGTGDPNEKGLLGALGGAAVGGYAGHQVNHGFLGAVGGAITGSVAEDAWKKKHKKDKKDKKDKKKYGFGGGGKSSSSSSDSSDSDSDDSKKKKKKKQSKSQYAAAGAAMAGNFSASSSGVELHGPTRLVAWCSPVHGAARRSELDLNSCLSNQGGNFVWARGGNFGASARNVRLVEGGRVLEAELGNGCGGWNRGWVRLDERVTNRDGRLEFLG